jgi:alkylhydroperoxidase family enzyme
MNRLPQIDPVQATGKAKQLLAAVRSKLGLVPKLIRVLANAPAALEGYLNFSGALAGGTLSVKVREQIALAVAQAAGSARNSPLSSPSASSRGWSWTTS